MSLISYSYHWHFKTNDESSLLNIFFMYVHMISTYLIIQLLIWFAQSAHNSVFLVILNIISNSGPDAERNGNIAYTATKQQAKTYEITTAFWVQTLCHFCMPPQYGNCSLVFVRKALHACNRELFPKVSERYVSKFFWHRVAALRIHSVVASRCS